MYSKLFGENEEICPQNEGKSISEHLKSKFSRRTPPSNLGPKSVYISVTPVTTTATAVQNSTENPALGLDFKQAHGYTLDRSHRISCLKFAM